MTCGRVFISAVVNVNIAHEMPHAAVASTVHVFHNVCGAGAHGPQ